VRGRRNFSTQKEKQAREDQITLSEPEAKAGRWYGNLSIVMMGG